MANDFNYGRIEFPVREKSSSNLKRKTTFTLMFFVTKTYCPF